MAVEYIRYTVPPGQGRGVRSGLPAGRASRSSAQFGEFFAAVKPFFDQIQEIKHYQVQPQAAAQ